LAVFCSVTAQLNFCLPDAGRLSDLILVRLENPGATYGLEALICALFDTARPVLVVAPSTAVSGSADFTGKAFVAWDSSLSAPPARTDQVSPNASRRSDTLA